MDLLFRNRLLAILAPVFWSITGLVVRLLEEADEWQVNFYRSSSLALFLLVYLGFRYRGQTLAVIRASGTKAVLGGVCIGIAMFCNMIAMQHTTIANATMVMAIGPIIAALFGWVLLGEAVSKMTGLAIVMAGVGLTIMVGGNPIDGSLFGDLIALFGMCGFGLYAVVLRHGKAVDMTPAVLWAGIFSALPAAFVALVFGNGLVLPLEEVAMCVGLGVFQLGIGSILFAIASATVPAVELTLFALGEPLLAPIWVWLAVNEVPSTSSFIGAGILLMALVTHLFFNRRVPARPDRVVIEAP
ncbi:MAG: DME family drug/metabolite transporter [Planctomycetota bacterium]|jgi:DME family drug/metabolite transporter